jgi:hypothetical protein
VILEARVALHGWKFVRWDHCSGTDHAQCTMNLDRRFPARQPVAVFEDFAAPDVKIVKLPPLNAGARLNPAFSSREPGATFACQVDRQAFAPCASGQAFTFTDGDHERTTNMCSLGGAASAGCGESFKALGLAINTSAPAIVTWTVDATAPEIAFEPMPDVTGTDVTGLWTPNEASTSTCRLDGAAAVPCANWFVAHDLAQGPHTLRVTVTDGFNARTYTRSWMVVTLPPAISTEG